VGSLMVPAMCPQLSHSSIRVFVNVVALASQDFKSVFSSERAEEAEEAEEEEGFVCVFARQGVALERGRRGTGCLRTTTVR
jgi:hypothetical protein